MPGASASPRSIYFVGAPVDALAMGGLSIAAAVVLAVYPVDLHAWPPYLALVCNWPHFAATNLRLYGSRQHREQYPFTTWLVPAVILVGLAATLAAPAPLAAPFVKFMLLWSPYHFSGQTIGLSLLYARRAGVAVDAPRRRSLTALVLATYLANTAHTEAGPGDRVYAGITHPKLDLPMWLGDGLDVVVVVLVAAYAWYWFRRNAADSRRPPAIVVLPVAAQAVWYVLARGIDAFTLFVPFFHSLEYLLVAWAVRVSEGRSPSTADARSMAIARATLRWWGAVIALGIVMFVGIPYALAAVGHDLTLALATVSAAIQLHHFFVDGVIWKLRTARTASPLMIHLGDALRPARNAAEAA